MDKLYTIQLTEDQWNTLLMGLRYLELNHQAAAIDPKDNESLTKQYRAEFTQILNIISSKLVQDSLFK